MFDIDRWREIFESISKNKLRTILTGFSVAFAILLFTLLFGIGNGLQNTFKKEFRRDADNAIYIYTGKTSKAYKGFQEGRRVKIDDSDYKFIRKEFGKDIQYISSEVGFWLKVTNEGESSRYSVNGVHPDNQFIDDNQLISGRYITRSDVNCHEKVAVIGQKVYKELFNGKSPLNKLINIDGFMYKIVGVFEDEGGDRDESVIYAPITTLQALYKNNDDVDNIKLTYSPKFKNKQALAFGKDIQQALRKKKNVHPRDASGVRIFNMVEANQQVGGLMFGINLVVFIIAFGTLIAGMIGVSNIMVFVVKERTRELGVRKALGAKPSSIIGMILQETMFITILAGYSGLLVGVGLLKWIAPKLEDYFITNASVNTGTIVVATLLLVFAGLMAGYFPAKRAARIKPIETLNVN